jgi:fructoselysine-6-P-deglycase FrlB-like protein
MGKRFIDELQQLPATMLWAAEQDVALLRRAVQLYGDRGLLAVGSGGSFTAAAYAADQHFRVYGRPSQAITPLDVFQVPTNAAANAAGLLLSAEGKNHDILAAAKQLRLRACPTIGLTLRSTSPLVELSDKTGAASLAAYDMPWGKDGYLATNSLIATLVLLWRAYEGDATRRHRVAASGELVPAVRSQHRASWPHEAVRARPDPAQRRRSYRGYRPRIVS